jgi:hypothetical protein
VAVVQDAAKCDGNELVPESPDVPVEGKALKIDVGCPEDRGARAFVAPTRLDADETILDNIDTANTMLATESVEEHEDLHGVRHRLEGIVYGGDLDGKTTLELDEDAFSGVGSVFGRCGELPHVCGRGRVGVLENAGLVRDMEEVLVGRPWLGCGLLYRDLLFSGVLEQGGTAGKAIVELYSRVRRWVNQYSDLRLTRVPPRGNDLDIGLEAVEGKFESDLIVALSSASV